MNSLRINLKKKSSKNKKNEKKKLLKIFFSPAFLIFAFPTENVFFKNLEKNRLLKFVFKTEITSKINKALVD